MKFPEFRCLRNFSLEDAIGLSGFELLKMFHGVSRASSSYHEVSKKIEIRRAAPRFRKSPTAGTFSFGK